VKADELPFVRRVGLALFIIVITLAALGLLVVATQVMLLAFAGILAAIFLDAFTSRITQHTRIPRLPALGLVILAGLGIATGLGFLVGPPLFDQFDHVARELPPVVRGLAEDIRRQKVFKALPSVDEFMAGHDVLGGVAGVFTTFGAGIAGFIFVAVIATFMAARPKAYVEPIVRLLPRPRRKMARDLFATIADALRHWLVARFVSMVVIGVLTGFGLWLAGVPAFASLGLLAGVLSFIPNFGPVLSALPGILLGLGESPMTAVWALLVYVGVQVLEGNFITPFAEQRAVSLPAAFLLTVELTMGLLAGVLGLLVATPLCVVVVLVIRDLHVLRIEAQEDRDAPPPQLRERAQASGAS
jgi:predicted PurR-regulated permease PerM